MQFVIVAIIVFLIVVWFGVVLIGPPYVPTLKRDLGVLFSHLKLNSKDHLVDLGSGDGKVLVAAAKYGTRVSGVEINPFLVLISRLRLRSYKGRVTAGDMWRYQLPADTSHVFVFPAEMFMNKLELYLVAQRAHTGSLLVAVYAFRFAGRTPERVVGAFNLYRF